MKLTVKHALECIFLNKRLSILVLAVASKKNNDKMLIPAVSILGANIGFKNKIDKGIKLSEEEKKALVATPKMFKDCHIPNSLLSKLLDLKDTDSSDIFGKSDDE